MTGHDLTNEAHRADCAECAATWAELEAIAAEARALPQLTPSRDLWAGIEARIAAIEPGRAEEAEPAGTQDPGGSRPAFAKAQRRWFTLPAVRYAAAAALLVTTTATVTWRIAADRPAAPGAAPDATAVAASPSDSEAAAAQALEGPAGALVREVSYERDFSAMDAEIGALRTLLEERRAQLEPQTLEVLERNLRLIDQAIAESRAALVKDPASQFLAAQLARAYSTKLTLLRSTATMPVGT